MGLFDSVYCDSQSVNFHYAHKIHQWYEPELVYSIDNTNGIIFEAYHCFHAAGFFLSQNFTPFPEKAKNDTGIPKRCLRKCFAVHDIELTRNFRNVMLAKVWIAKDGPDYKTSKYNIKLQVVKIQCGSYLSLPSLLLLSCGLNGSCKKST